MQSNFSANDAKQREAIETQCTYNERFRKSKRGAEAWCISDEQFGRANVRQG